MRPDTRMLLAQVVEKLEDRVEQGPSLAALQHRFPKFEILELVGRGGMASVYKAWDPRLERFIAIKVLDESLAQQPDFAERFAREAKTLSGLQHPHILRPLDYGEKEGLFFIVSEYYGGGNLAQHLQEGELSADHALTLLREIGGALAYAHDQGIVHRDLKPSNILIDDSGHACLADFGIVHLLGKKNETIALTRTRQAMGTPHYLAPEMMNGDVAVDARADIYALGVTAYELLTGRLPLGRFDPPSKHTMVGPGVDAAIDRCLHPDPDQRWKSVSEFLAALNESQEFVDTRPFWPRARNWTFACIVLFVLLESMDVVLRMKTGRWLLPSSFGAEVSMLFLASGWVWISIDRVWSRRPAQRWLIAIRRAAHRWMHLSLIAFSGCVLLLLMKALVGQLHPGRSGLIQSLFGWRGDNVFLLFSFPQICLFLVVAGLLVLELLSLKGIAKWRSGSAKLLGRSHG